MNVCRATFAMCDCILLCAAALNAGSCGGLTNTVLAYVTVSVQFLSDFMQAHACILTQQRATEHLYISADLKSQAMFIRLGAIKLVAVMQQQSADCLSMLRCGSALIFTCTRLSVSGLPELCLLLQLLLLCCCQPSWHWQ